MTFKEYMKIRGLSKNTIKNYLCDIKKMNPENTTKKNTEENYKKKIGKLQDEGCASSSINRFLDAHNLYYHFKGNSNPVSKIGRLKLNMRTPDFLNLAELKKFTEHPETKYKNRTRDKTILMIFKDTGMRLNELISLQVDNLNLEKKRIKLYRSKNRTEFEVPIRTETAEQLKRYMNRANLNGKLFNVSTRYIQLLCERTGKKVLGRKITPHTLRHTRGFSWIARGGDIRTLQVLLGHKDISTTMRYTHITPDVLQDSFSKIEE